ncbi:hypothetical protein [Microvirga flavescens]|uniref:hypothetical protein n=1 Tax=Microvirga flavescens TaxID=2249811 RepID=UPI000DD82B6F|nr:hypothetical protein [Microvirga flavescens]
MKYAAAFILALVLAVVVSDPAHAHRPYYSQVEKIRLPDGQIGEVRLLHGDGVIVTDPVRPILVDGKGRLIARGPKFYSLVVSCDAERHCIIVDLWSVSTLTLDPASFREGAEQSTAQPRDRTDDWALEGEVEDWGFSVREATSSEFWSATLAQATMHIPFFLVLTGLAAAGAAIFVVPLRLSSPSVVCLWVARAFFLIAGLVIYCLFAGLSFMFAMFAGLSAHLWLLSLLLGTFGLWISVWGVRKSARKVAVPESRRTAGST